MTTERFISAIKHNCTKRNARLGMLACLVLLVGMLAPAKDGRDFAGFYEVVDAMDLGEEVHVTLRFRIFNYGDADVHGAIITLEDSVLPTSYGSFDFISIGKQQSVLLEKDFFIPQREYDRWQSGATPRLSVQYTDAAANTVYRSVELIQMLVGEEAQL